MFLISLLYQSLSFFLEFTPVPSQIEFSVHSAVFLSNTMPQSKGSAWHWKERKTVHLSRWSVHCSWAGKCSPTCWKGWSWKSGIAKAHFEWLVFLARTQRQMQINRTTTLHTSRLQWYSLWFTEIARILYRSLFETWVYITNPLKYYNE